MRRARTAIVAAGLSLAAAITPERPLHASQAEPLLQPTPLVLKDGRIASVSIHVVPFAPGEAELAAGTEARVAELTRAVGTDCFLTAQVIGHIDSSEVAQDNTLDAHRLARSRADAVQASLIGGGLPAKAIASVWDWQFIVRAPRVTLWVFELTAGEDCEGRPLHGDMVAQAPPSPRQAIAEPERAIVSALAPVERTARAAAVAPVASQLEATARSGEPSATGAEPKPAPERPGAASITPSSPAPEGERLVPGRPAEQQETETTVPARPAPAPKATTSDDRLEQPAEPRDTGTTVPARLALAPEAVTSDGRLERPAEPRDTGTVVAAKPRWTPPPSNDSKVERGPDGDLVITFATNSSFFPSGTAKELGNLIAGLDAASRYEVTLQVAVGGTTKVVGAKSPQEAARYNKWLAERRLARVHEWLLESAAAEALSINPTYVIDDDSRQVIVRVAPVG